MSFVTKMLVEGRSQRQVAKELDGGLVRWQLVGVQDVYEIYDAAIDPHGIGIYSRLRRVRMKPEYRWSRRSERAARDTTARRRSR